MTADQKLAEITAKNFTYVTATYFDPNQPRTEDYDLPCTDRMVHDRFIVLSPSLPVVRSAARQIALSRLPEGAYLADDPEGAYNKAYPGNGIGRGRDGALSFYPRNYVLDAKAMVKADPSDVYALTVQTSVSFS
jgi:hypothetical protein